MFGSVYSKQIFIAPVFILNIFNLSTIFIEHLCFHFSPKTGCSVFRVRILFIFEGLLSKDLFILTKTRSRSLFLDLFPNFYCQIFGSFLNSFLCFAWIFHLSSSCFFGRYFLILHLKSQFFCADLTWKDKVKFVSKNLIYFLQSKM